MAFWRRDGDTVVHREILQTVALILVAVAGFVVTRAVAASSRTATLRDAEAWFDRGRAEMARGQLDDAIASLRRAALRSRSDRRYVLSLAHALALQNETDQARAALLALRESAPDDPEINLELARLAARRQDVTEAVRFYRNALYAPWPVEASDARRAARLELIEFLLDHQQTGRALSELLGVANDLPDQPAAHNEIGALFSRAGDYTRALDQFERALRTDPADPAALAGAGLSAFHLGNLPQAQKFLRAAPSDRSDVIHARTVTDLVLSKDPLGSRIGNAERRRRLITGVEYLQDRLVRCASSGAAPPATGSATAEGLVTEFRDRIDHTALLDQDTIEAGLDLISEAEHQLAACGPPEPMDEALTLIVRAHASEIR
jgi:Flp pilus assembly protein TadD